GVLIAKMDPKEKNDTDAAATATAADPNLSKVDNVVSETVESPSAAFADHTILEHINRTDSPETLKTDPQIDISQIPSFARVAEKKGKPWSWANFDNTALPRGFTLGTVEIGIILGLVNLLFLSF